MVGQEPMGPGGREQESALSGPYLLSAHLFSIPPSFRPIHKKFWGEAGPGGQSRGDTVQSAFQGVLPEPQASACCLQAQGIGLFLACLEGLECLEA